MRFILEPLKKYRSFIIPIFALGVAAGITWSYLTKGNVAIYFNAIVAIILACQLYTMWLRNIADTPRFTAYAINKKGRKSTRGVWANIVRLHENQLMDKDKVISYMQGIKRGKYIYGIISIVLVNQSAKPITIRKILVDDVYNGIFAELQRERVYMEVMFVDKNNKPLLLQLCSLRDYQNMLLPAYVSMPIFIIVPFKDQTKSTEEWPTPQEIKIRVEDIFENEIELKIKDIHVPGKKKSEWDIFDKELPA